jgi:hypothetical protein
MLKRRHLLAAFAAALLAGPAAAAEPVKAQRRPLALAGDQDVAVLLPELARGALANLVRRDHSSTCRRRPPPAPPW